MKKIIPAKKLRFYFAHPVNTYDTPLEKYLLGRISGWFPNVTLDNPNSPFHHDVVRRIKAEDPKANVMPHFLEVARTCDGVLILPFGDGMIGAGVFEESYVVSQKGGTMWLVDPSKRVTITHIKRLDPKQKLSIDETRARVYRPDRTLKPYA